MSPINYTPITPGAPANAAIINAPINQLDLAIGDLTTLATTSKALIGGINELQSGVIGGATVNAQQLKDWAEGEAYQMTGATFDADNVISGATVLWPDGSGGTFTTTTKDGTWFAINAYTITHTASGKTVTQSAVTRDGNGNITSKPSITVA